MAKPAFIYAFDNLGPYRFTELCGELLGSRHRGFMLGGEGADGGIDGEIDKVLGIWQPEYEEALLADVIRPGQTVVFQFKHKVSARVGQVQSRTQLLSLYKCGKSKTCELHSELVQERKPIAYVLVTNVEVNSQFRENFINQCKGENSSIRHYQIIGLDELVSWIEMMPELRQLYFPTIFGIPRFDLRVHVSFALPISPSGFIEGRAISIAVNNMGIAPSYLDANAIAFSFIVNGKQEAFTIYLGSDALKFTNPTSPIKLEPGRSQSYFFPQSCFRDIRGNIESFFKTNEKLFPVEIRVKDEIGNTYLGILDDDKRKAIMSYMYE